jgi:hypothetical protein
VYYWNPDEPEESREHKLLNVERVCDTHKHIVDDNKLYETVVDENSRPNRVFNFILQLIPRRGTESGQARIRFLKSIYSYEFDDTRSLVVTLNRLDDDTKRRLQRRINREFGENKVIIQ